MTSNANPADDHPPKEIGRMLITSTLALEFSREAGLFPFGEYYARESL